MMLFSTFLRPHEHLFSERRRVFFADVLPPPALSGESEDDVDPKARESNLHENNERDRAAERRQKWGDFFTAMSNVIGLPAVRKSTRFGDPQAKSEGSGMTRSDTQRESASAPRPQHSPDLVLSRYRYLASMLRRTRPYTTARRRITDEMDRLRRKMNPTHRSAVDLSSEAMAAWEQRQHEIGDAGGLDLAALAEQNQRNRVDYSEQDRRASAPLPFGPGGSTTAMIGGGPNQALYRQQYIDYGPHIPTREEVKQKWAGRDSQDRSNSLPSQKPVPTSGPLLAQEYVDRSERTQQRYVEFSQDVEQNRQKGKAREASRELSAVINHFKSLSQSWNALKAISLAPGMNRNSLQAVCNVLYATMFRLHGHMKEYTNDPQLLRSLGKQMEDLEWSVQGMARVMGDRKIYTQSIDRLLSTIAGKRADGIKSPVSLLMAIAQTANPSLLKGHNAKQSLGDHRKSA